MRSCLLRGTDGVNHEQRTLGEILSEEFPAEGYDTVIADELVRVAEDPGMGVNRVGHVIEVVRPHVDVILILAEKLDADPVNVGLDSVVIERTASSQKLFGASLVNHLHVVCHEGVSGGPYKRIGKGLLSPVRGTYSSCSHIRPVIVQAER